MRREHRGRIVLDKIPSEAKPTKVELPTKKGSEVPEARYLFRRSSSKFGTVVRRHGAKAESAVAEAIFARYRTDSVRALARSLTSLPAERLSTTGRFAFDRVTQIHEPQIGDTRSGKWHDLPPDLQSELTRRFAPFLKQFGYA